MTRTVWIVVTPRATQASLSLLGTPSSSSCTVKPSVKPSTQPRQAASRWMRAGSLFPSLSMLEQTSKKSLPDLLISGCSGVLFGPVLAGEPTKPVLARKQIKKSASSTGTRSKRTAASNQLRDSTFYLECCQQSEAYRRNADGAAIQPPDRRIGAFSPRFFVNPTATRNAFRYPIANKPLKVIIDKQYQYAIMFSLGRQDSPLPC